MKNYFNQFFRCLAFFVISMYTLMLMLPTLAMSAGGEKLDIMVIVADTRGLMPFEAWWANLYNDSHIYFALLTVVLIPVIGIIFGTIADFFMKMIGLDLEHRELSEH